VMAKKTRIIRIEPLGMDYCSCPVCQGRMKRHCSLHSCEDCKRAFLISEVKSNG